MLAALNIADECFRARDEDATRRRDLDTRAGELERMLDLALGSEPELSVETTPNYSTANYSR